MKLIFLDVDGVLNHSGNSNPVEHLVRNLCKVIVECDARIVVSSTWRLSPQRLQELKEEVAELLDDMGYEISAEEMEFLKSLNSQGQNDQEQDKEIEKVKNVTLRRRFLKATQSRQVMAQNTFLKYQHVFIGITPSVCEFPLHLNEANSHFSRTDEILLWLRENIEFKSPKNEIYEPKSDHKILESERFGNLVWKLERKIPLSNFVVLDDMPLDEVSCFRHKADFAKHFVKTDFSVGFVDKLLPVAVKILNSKFDSYQWALKAFTPCDNPHCLVRADVRKVKTLQKTRKARKAQKVEEGCAIL